LRRSALDEAFEITKAHERYEAQIAYSPHEIYPEFINELLRDAPDIVNPKPKRSLRKEIDPIRIFTVLASIWLLASNPFSKKFLERYGEETAMVQ
jgi:hypothetical protein